LAVVPGSGPARSALGVRKAGCGAPLHPRVGLHDPHRPG
jgi:hypothetical protein